MSNEEVTITELTIEELKQLMDEADIIHLNSEDRESITYHSIGEEGITMNFENKEGEEFLFLFNDDAKIVQNGNKVTIEQPDKPDETCEFLMFKKVPFSG